MATLCKCLLVSPPAISLSQAPFHRHFLFSFCFIYSKLSGRCCNSSLYLYISLSLSLGEPICWHTKQATKQNNITQTQTQIHSHTHRHTHTRACEFSKYHYYYCYCIHGHTAELNPERKIHIGHNRSQSNYLLLLLLSLQLN